MLRVRDDDAAAFEELVRRYQGRLITVLRNLMGSRELAEDLAQDVFLRVYRARKTYTADAKFSTWLFRIATNVSKNAKRTKSRRKEVNVTGAGSGAVSANPLDNMAQAASGLMPARQLDKVERAQMVQIAMESLNDRQKMAVLLSRFEGMSYADIASTMDLSVSAIKSLLSRARTNLKVALEPYVELGALPNEVAE
jgi:RNA polymerase sigma-70 factor (ECF subfamily)